MSVEISLRLTEERTRAGFTQADMARQLGVSRETMRKWEAGLAPVGSEALSKAYSLGIDVQYVLTGVRAVRAPTEPSMTTGAVSGGVGIATGNANVQFITTTKHITRTRPVIQAGSEHISDCQASALAALVNEIVETEAKLKEKGGSHRAVWAALNRHCGVTQYRLIPAASFDRARKYLNSWMGRLHAMASAPIKDGDSWRKRHYAYIKINSKDAEARAALERYLADHFSASSITELSNPDLERVYRYVASRRARRGKS